VPKVRSALKRKQPALRALGLEVERRDERTERSSKATMITLVREPSQPEPTTSAETRRDEAADTPPMNGRSGGPQADLHGPAYYV